MPQLSRRHQSWTWRSQAQPDALMWATCRFGRSLTMADPKGFPQEVPLELHLKLTAWPLGHERAEFEVRKGSVPCRQFGLFLERYKIAGGIAPGAGPHKGSWYPRGPGNGQSCLSGSGSAVMWRSVDTRPLLSQLNKKNRSKKKVVKKGSVPKNRSACQETKPACPPGIRMCH